MAGGYSFKEFSDGQRRNYDAAVQIYAAFLEALRETRAFKGGRHWKRIKGRDYLYQYFDRLGHGRSLGPRSLHTEELLAQFTRARQKAARGLRDVRLKLAEQSRFCRAALINRVPRATARILRHLEQHQLWRNLLIIGSAAIYAYEFAAEVFLLYAFEGNVLMDAQSHLTMAEDGKVSWEEFLRLLWQVDRSFAPVAGEDCSAANRDGFLVRLLKSEARRPRRQKAVTVPGARQPLPPDAGHIQYLLAAPKFSQVVIGRDGGPATMVVPDPWAFALNRLWWSQQDDRDTPTRARDRDQALGVAGLVLRYLPQYDFSSSELEMFPSDLVHYAEGFDAGTD